MEERKAILKLINWNGNIRFNTLSNSEAISSFSYPSTISYTLSLNANNKPNSDYPKLIQGHKDIKINPLNIVKFRYNNNIGQFNNWLEDLKIAYDRNPAKYLTNRQKIIMASITIDE